MLATKQSASDKIERAISLALAVAALAIAAVVVRREFFPSVAPTSNRPVPVFKDDWREFRKAGIAFDGSAGAPVEIVEFGDFECPVCAAFEPTLQAVTSKYGDQISRVFVHFPIPGHRFARPAALAAECAHQQGAFAAMKAVLYARQDSFGLRPWTNFAREAGVADLARFDACVAAPESGERIDKGFALAERLGFRGTPTIVLNGWAINGILGELQLAQAIDAALNGKGPPGSE
ncbi:MAG TPA: thioredoxin domain-containing protein [Gemmatimonadaceae bacterium]|nr:thioredoxin domain-containing protein [Gemmatimonadaceae bacterium]